MVQWHHWPLSLFWHFLETYQSHFLITVPTLSISEHIHTPLYFSKSQTFSHIVLCWSSGLHTLFGLSNPEGRCMHAQYTATSQHPVWSLYYSRNGLCHHFMTITHKFMENVMPRGFFFSLFAAPCPVCGPSASTLQLFLACFVCTLCALHNGHRQHHGILELTWIFWDSIFDLNT
jgi:hypothetical protein